MDASCCALSLAIVAAVAAGSVMGYRSWGSTSTSKAMGGSWVARIRGHRLSSHMTWHNANNTTHVRHDCVASKAAFGVPVRFVLLVPHGEHARQGTAVMRAAVEGGGGSA